MILLHCQVQLCYVIYMIILQPHNPNWAQQFEQEKATLLRTAGQWIKQIEHIGSTAIPGICAKPTVDILLGVTDLAIADQHLVKAIVSLGYDYIQAYEAQMPCRRFFYKDSQPGERLYHIHLVEKDSDFWQRHLLFRDYLRSHQDAAQAYEQLKLALAPEYTDGNEYAAAKTDFIQSIQQLAGYKQ